MAGCPVDKLGPVRVGRSTKMAAEDGINVLLEKADLQEFVGSFLTLGCTKVSHVVDVDNEMMKNIGMKDLQIKGLNRIFQEQNRTPPPENPDRLEAGQSHSVNELPVAGPYDSNETQPLASIKMSKKIGPKQSGILKRACYSIQQ